MGNVLGDEGQANPYRRFAEFCRDSKKVATTSVFLVVGFCFSSLSIMSRVHRSRRSVLQRMSGEVGLGILGALWSAQACLRFGKRQQAAAVQSSPADAGPATWAQRLARSAPGRAALQLL
jgi:hypothetical protein